MNINDAIQSNYIKSDDLKGQDQTYTISGCYMEVMEDRNRGEKEKAVLQFSDAKKEFVLNVTNIETLKELFGSPETDDWIGKQITLYPDRCQMGRKIVNCIRIRDRLPAASAPPPPPKSTGPHDQTYWIYREGNDRAQQIDGKQITELIQGGLLKKDHQVCQVGTQEWKTAESLGLHEPWDMGEQAPPPPPK